MNAVKMTLLILSLSGAMVVYLFSQYRNGSPSGLPQVTIDAAAPPVVTVIGTSELAEVQPGIGSDGPIECLTINQVRDHPVVRQLMQQRDAAAVSGADIEIFRGLDEAQVLGYAEQGDSAAMVVTGAIRVMRAYGLDSSSALDWLNNDGNIAGVDTAQLLSSDASLALNDAAYWFYQAALNGRLMALQHYGQVRSQLFGGPVGLGWISPEEYDLLGTDRKNEISPMNMYRGAALDMIPGAREGFIQGLGRSPAVTETAEPIRNDILHEFDLALSNSALPPPSTAAVSAEFEKLRSQVCDSEFQEARRFH